MRATAFFVRGLVLAACLLVGAPARADKTAEAEDLFRRAKALMGAKKHAAACPLLEESQRLDPQMGTLLNLALCHEQIGRIASAWGELRAVEQQARAAVPPREDRVKLARTHADKLEPRLSRIRLVVPDDARAAGLVLKVDGEEKGEPLWSGIPVDPGVRKVEATAPGKKPRTLDVKVEEEGAVVPVTIPALEDAPVATTPVIPPPSTDQTEEYASNRARRTTGFIVGGLGAATLVAGGAFGVLAILSDDDAKKACPAPCIDGSPAAADADRETDRALLFANVSNVALPLGAIGAAIGAYLVLTAGPTERVAVTPLLSRRATGLSVSSRW